MREAVDMMHYVWAAYAVGTIGTVSLLVWSWLDMRRAEKKRERIRGR